MLHRSRINRAKAIDPLFVQLKTYNFSVRDFRFRSGNCLLVEVPCCQQKLAINPRVMAIIKSTARRILCIVVNLLCIRFMYFFFFRQFDVTCIISEDIEATFIAKQYADWKNIFILIYLYYIFFIDYYIYINMFFAYYYICIIYFLYITVFILIYLYYIYFIYINILIYFFIDFYIYINIFFVYYYIYITFFYTTVFILIQFLYINIFILHIFYIY